MIIQYLPSGLYRE